MSVPPVNGLSEIVRQVLPPDDSSLQWSQQGGGSLPVQRKRAAVEKGVKMTLAAMLPATVRYRVLHHASKSNMDLQIADYCTWAVYRKWNGGDERSFNRVKAAVRSEWDVLQAGTGFPD